MSSFTIFVIIVIIVAAFFGWRAGIIKQVGRLAGIVLGIAVCRVFGPTVVDIVCSDTTASTDKILYTVLSYIVLFVVIYLGVSIVGALLRKMFNVVHLGFLDRLAGAAFNVVEWLVLLSLLLNLWMMIMPETTLGEDPMFDRVLWFGPALLGTDTALSIKSAVNTAIHG